MFETNRIIRALKEEEIRLREETARLRSETAILREQNKVLEAVLENIRKRKVNE
jgi:hypothetical protein